MTLPLPCKQRWHWQATRIRCALTPDEPRLILCHLAEGHLLAQHGHFTAWEAARRALSLLLDTAADQALPHHWRHACLDQAFRPMQQLAHCAHTEAQQAELAHWRWRLAHTDMSAHAPFLDDAQPPSTPSL